MSTRELATTPPPTRWPYRRRGVKAALITALLGPLIGGLPFLLLFVVPLALNLPTFTTPAGEIIASLANITLAIAIGSYMLGGVQALAAGLWIGRRIARSGTVSYRQAMLISLVISAAVTIGLVSMDLISGQEPSGTLGLCAMLTGLSLLSAVVCCWLVRRRSERVVAE